MVCEPWNTQRNNGHLGLTHQKEEEKISKWLITREIWVNPVPGFPQLMVLGLIRDSSWPSPYCFACPEGLAASAVLLPFAVCTCSHTWILSNSIVWCQRVTISADRLTNPEPGPHYRHVLAHVCYVSQKTKIGFNRRRCLGESTRSKIILPALILLEFFPLEKWEISLRGHWLEIKLSNTHRNTHIDTHNYI